MAASRGKFGGASSWLLVDGYNLIAGKLKTLAAKIEAIQEETTGLGDTWGEHTPVGLAKGTVTQTGGYFDTSANGPHAALSGALPTTPQAAVRVVTLGFGGHTIGESFVGFAGALTNEYEVLAEVGNLTKANAVHAVSGLAEWGDIIHELSVETVDWNTKTQGNSHDYTLSTTQRTVAISNISVANPTVVTTVGNHNLTTGDLILVSGSDSTPTINGSRAVTVVTATTFTVPVNVTVQGTTGSYVLANSTEGAVGYQQVTALSGFTGFVGKLRDSADDTTYADLITFANVTSAPGFERATVAGVCDRYMSYDGNVTGTGSITVFCGIARNPQT